MRVLIVGGGVVGTNLAEALSLEGQEVSLVDSSPEVVERLNERLDVLAVCGEGASLEILEEAGIGEAELVIAVTDNDHRNLIICLLASRYPNVKRKIARVRNTELSGDVDGFLRERLGIDKMIHTGEEVVETLLRLIEVPGSLEVADFADGEILFRGFPVGEQTDFADLMLRELRARIPEPPFLLAGVVRDDEFLIPTGQTRILAGDTISVVIAKQHLSAFLPHVGMTVKAAQRIVLAHASHVALQLAERLEQRGHEVVLIEPERSRCEAASAQLDGTAVLNGAPTDLAVLRDAAIDLADYFVALSDNDEENVMAVLLAKKSGARRVALQTNTAEMAHILHSLGLDATVDPRLLTVAAILHTVRHGRVLSMAKIGRGRAEAIEFEATEGIAPLKKPLREVRLPDGSLIGAIGRGGQVIIPDGSTAIEAGDRVLVFALPEAVGAVCTLFSVKKRSGWLRIFGG